ncbi:MAG: hypothetical protein JXX14_21960 [Deltaproteobacteria bacterium]|nr:hypothetical protein [Deltaproteobacteria bacterium]
MDLTLFEQWKLLVWLLANRDETASSEMTCLAMHHLLVDLIGENYQQIACEPPPATLRSHSWDSALRDAANGRWAPQDGGSEQTDSAVMRRPQAISNGAEQTGADASRILPEAVALNLLVRIYPEHIMIVDASSGNGLHHVTSDGTVPDALSVLLLQNRIHAFEVSDLDNMNLLLERYGAQLKQLPLLTPIELSEDNARLGAGNSAMGRKWKKFRRDPVLFFRDLFGKWLARGR